MNIIISLIILTVFGLTIIFAPFALVWAINVLFDLHNEYNIVSWLASVVLIVTMLGIFKPTNAEKHHGISGKDSDP
jgi:uncharacterized membrane protein